MATDMLSEVRTRVEAQLPGENGAAVKLDPTTWLALLSAVLEVVQECLKKKTDRPVIAASLRRPMLGQQLVVRRKIIKELGRAQFKKLGPEIVQALVDVGQNATPEEADLFLQQLTNA